MVEVPHSPILTAMFRHAADTPEKTAVVTTDGLEISYSALQRNVLRGAEWLSKQGVSFGDRIMISAEKEVKFIYLYLAAHLIGAVNVVVGPDDNATHLKRIAEITGPVLFIGLETAGVNKIHYQEIDLSVREETCGNIPACCKVCHGGIYPDTTADVMFTSGTTGKPKGVILTHANIAASAENINTFIGNGAGDIELLGLPLCHSFGLGRLRCCLLSGATVILHNGFANLKSVFNAFEKYGVTGFGMVPSVWAYIKRFSCDRIARYAPQMKYLEIGSASLPYDDKQLLCELFPTARICMHYGLTEASRAAFMELHEDKEHLESVGKSVSRKVDIRILGEDGREIARGEEGEICIKGDIVTPGYLDSAQTEEAFYGSYLRTGDSGYLNEEGYLYLTDRLKEIINVGGKKVSPMEIEEAVRRISGAEAVCIGVSDPDGILGEVPRLLILRDSLRMDIDELKSRLREKIETYKYPRFFETVDTLPLTATGKNKRRIK